jgi:hypothetical protein
MLTATLGIMSRTAHVQQGTQEPEVPLKDVEDMTQMNFASRRHVDKIPIVVSKTIELSAHASQHS